MKRFQNVCLEIIFRENRLCGNTRNVKCKPGADAETADKNGSFLDPKLIFELR